jgi:heat-inducible transcriptional repressor
VPTDAGYRTYVDALMADDPQPPALVADLRAPQRPAGEAGARIDAALRDTTRALAEATGLLAVVTAPRAMGTTIRHVEVLHLQPSVVVVVVITATGDVARHVVSTSEPLDPGLVDWASAYLREELAGAAVGESRMRQRLAGAGLTASEQWILGLLAPAFHELEEDTQELLIGGSSSDLALQGAEVQHVAQLVAMLDERRRVLEALQAMTSIGGILMQSSSRREVRMSIGGENAMPELRRVSIVGAAYGTHARSLGMVGVIGPRAMDYARAAVAVHAAAGVLSDLSSTVYE